jgi:hypothetical protein
LPRAFVIARCAVFSTSTRSCTVRAFRTVSISESAVGPSARRSERSIWARWPSVAASSSGRDATSKRLGMCEALNTESVAPCGGDAVREAVDERRLGAGADVGAM